MIRQEIQQKLYEKLKPSGWGNVLKSFLLSDDFGMILQSLHDNLKQDKRFTPPLKDIFNAFQECPYNELKVIIVGQDPYPQLDVADGLCFSCSKSDKAQPSLNYIFSEIERTVYPYEKYNRDLDLRRWSHQGVLLLNTALTCEINNIGSHVELWKSFITYLLDMLNTYNSGLIYVFLGNNAKTWHKHVSSNNYKLFASHPVSVAYKGKKIWDSGNIFNQINVILNNNNGDKIIW
jgi:uracil-DNA glycosylase